MTQLIEKIEAYRINPYGLINPGKVPCENPLLFTVQYGLEIMRLYKSGGIKADVYISEMNKIHNALMSLEVQPGLLCRYPGNKERDSFDNAIARLTWSYLTQDGFAQRFTRYGRNLTVTGIDETDPSLVKQNLLWFWVGKLTLLIYRPWLFNLPAPDKFSAYSWLGRNPSFTGFAKLCARERITIIEYLAILVFLSQSFFAKKDSYDFRTLGYLMLQVIGDKFGFRTMKKLWFWKLNKDYGIRGIYMVYQLYFNRPDYPITQIN